jgi:serine/threonine protein kinase
VVLLGLGAPPRDLPIGYQPPEQVAGAFTDTRSDQWRLGALLVELVLGSQLYAGLDDPDEAASVGQVGPWVSRLERRQPALARIAGKMLAPAAGNRYNDENVLVRDLLECARLIGGQPDRRVMASRMNAIRDAENRRTAEAATTIDDPRPPNPEPPHNTAADAADVAQAARPEPPPPEEATAAMPQTPVATDSPPVPRPEPVLDAPAATVVAVEMTEDEPSLGLGRVAVADQEDDGPSLGSNLPGLPHTEDPFNDPLEVPIDGSALPHMAINAPIDGLPGQPDPEARPSSEPSSAADSEVEATEVVSRPAQASPAGPAGPRPSKWFPSELGAMAAVGIASLMAIAFLIWRFG